MLHTNITVNEKGHLAFAGMDTVTLAEKYGTPLMLIDENRIRERAATYIGAMKRYFGGESKPLYASKALSFTGIYKIIADAGMSIDIVSAGELYTAKNAGFPLENAYFHGNNKPIPLLNMLLIWVSAALLPTAMRRLIKSTPMPLKRVLNSVLCSA